MVNNSINLIPKGIKFREIRKMRKNKIKYIHTNIIAKDWRKLADFYIKVFGCTKVFPERNLKGKWIDTGADVNDVHIVGIHLKLPGYSEDGPTLVMF